MELKYSLIKSLAVGISDNNPDEDIFQSTVSIGQKRKSFPKSNQDMEKEVDINLQSNPCSTTTISSETSTANSQTVDIINESMIELEKRANETIKRLLPSKDLEDLWKLVMDRMSEKNIKVQAIELRIIDLTNWSSLEWSRILKTEDKAKLFRACWIEKESKAVHTRKRRKIHAEYVKLGNESTKLDVVIELRNYDNFYDVLHFKKKKDLAETFVMGIQATEVAMLIDPKPCWQRKVWTIH
ncbi:unnamed protein product [Rhizophagus irregularis]|uniref:Uncharacterized protein n=2 Tax=Rhizophagus irregularis TaxID=588596 RepID=A0A915YZI2_9GLOM|nr:unnamed protein product [Rhizophagus irregularis]